MNGRRHNENDYALRPDTSELSDYDGGWIGVDMLSAPDRVAKNKVAFARNKRFRKLDAEPRRGIKEMEWASTALINGIFDAIAFSSVDDYEWILRATADRVLISRPEAESWIDLPDHVTLDADTRLVQALNKVYLFRGYTRDPLVWTPASDPSNPQANAFTTVPPAEVNASISQSLLAIWRNQRLWVAHDRDTVSVSDINDPTEYNTANDLYIERGAQDSLVALYPYYKDIIAFKTERLFLLRNITGSIDEVDVDEIETNNGLVSPFAVTKIGQDIWYLSAAGVLSLTQVLDNELQGQAAAKSREIKPLLDLVNWQAAGGIVSEYWDSKYYLALPIQGSAANNVVAVYDSTWDAWQGFDQSERHNVFRFVKLKYQGRQRLFFVDTAGAVFLYEEDYEDVWDGVGHPIRDAVLTRGYECGYADQKKFFQADLALATQNPQLKVSTVVNGFH